MRTRGTLGQRLVRSAGIPLAGGAAMTAFIAWSAGHWWVGPSVVGAVVLGLAALWRW